MLVLLDSSIYIFRGWQSMPASLTDRFGNPANAVMGFANTLADVMRHTKPSHMACAFDECFRQGIRNSIYPEYKADRPPAPLDLAPQFGTCKQVASAMGIFAQGSPRVEADDIIGQFAQLANKVSMPVTIVTGDKDLAQFITEQDTYWNYSKQLRMSFDDLIKRFKIRPDQIPDWLALAGDKSDNIPGVPGVGPTTAAKLLVKWDSIEKLLENLGEVAMMGFRGAPRVSRLLYEHKEDIYLARKLTGLIYDEDISLSLEDLKREVVTPEAVSEQLFALGFTEQNAASVAARLA